MSAAEGRPRRDPEGARLAAVVNAFTTAGLDVFAVTQRTLDAATQLEDKLRKRRDAATAHERDLIDRLADGTLDVDGAVHELSATAAPGIDDVVERAAARVRGRAVDAARREALPAHAALAKPLALAVHDAVEAGRRCVDVDRVVRVLRNDAMYRDAVRPLLENAPVHEAWPAAVAASNRVRELMQLAEMLASVGGPGSSLWAPGRQAIGEAAVVGTVVPPPLHVAVGDGMDWSPGLYAVDEDPRPPGGTGESRKDRDAAVLALARRLTGVRG